MMILRVATIMNIILLLLVFSSEAKDYLITDFGAVPNSNVLNTKAIQAAIDKANAEGGGMVKVPVGTFLSGTIYLKSNVNLHLSPGSVLLGTPKKELYENEALIYAEDQHDIAISGNGKIDGQGWHSNFRSKNHLNGIPGRPIAVWFKNCRFVTLENFTLVNSACWCIKLQECVFATADKLNVLSRVVANNDGIDVCDCHNVTISNCKFDCGDDAICVKSDSYFGVENMTVSNCIIRSESNGIKFGTSSVGGFRNVTINNCVIYDTRLSGIALEVVDGATMQNISIGNITMKEVNGGIFIKLGHRGGGKPGVLRDVIIHDIIATGIGIWKPDTTASYFKLPKGSPLIGMSVLGLPGYEVENILLSNIYMQFAGGGSSEDACREIEDTPSVYPEYTNAGITPAYGINVKNAKRISLSNVRLEYIEEDFRPAFYLKNVEEAELSQVKMKISPEAGSFIMLEDVRNVVISQCKPAAKTVPFLELKGIIENISVINNDLSQVKQPFVSNRTVSQSEIKIK